MGMEEKYPYYGATSVMDYVDEFIFSGLHLLLAEDGSVLNEDGTPILQLVDGEFWVNNHAHVLRGSDDTDTRFIFYALSIAYAAPWITGAVQLKLNQRWMNKIQIYYPERPRREFIVEKLGKIDQLISSVNAMADTCENMVSTLFRSWFIDFDPVKGKSEGKSPYGMDEETAALFPNSFEASELGPIPAGWKVSSISEICKMSSGGTPSRSKYEYFSTPDTGYPGLASREISWNIIHKAQEHISEIGLKNSSAKLFPETTTVMAMYGGGTVGRCGFLGSSMTTSQAVCAMVPKHKLCLPIYLYSLIKSESERIVRKYAVGGAQVNLSQRTIGEHLIVLPPYEIIQKFESLVDELFVDIDTSSTQLEKLSEIRDALLPKLMSGELEV